MSRPNFSFMCTVNASTMKTTTMNFPEEIQVPRRLICCFITNDPFSALRRRHLCTVCISDNCSTSDALDECANVGEHYSPAVLLQELPNQYAACCNTSVGGTVHEYFAVDDNITVLSLVTTNEVFKAFQGGQEVNVNKGNRDEQPLNRRRISTTMKAILSFGNLQFCLASFLHFAAKHAVCLSAMRLAAVTHFSRQSVRKSSDIFH